VKKKKNKGDVPDNNISSKKNSSSVSRKASKTKKSPTAKVNNKSRKEPTTKRGKKKASKDYKKKQEQILRSNVKITKRKSRIALALGIIFVLAAVLTASFTTIALIQKPLALVEISTAFIAKFTPIISFISTASIGLYPTAIVFLIIGIGIFSIRNYKPWSTFTLLLTVGAIYILHLISNQAYSSSFPQYVEVFFKNLNIDTAVFSQQLILYLIADIVLIMVLSPVFEQLNEKWQIRVIKLQLKKEKEIIEEQKELERIAKTQLNDDLDEVKIKKENINTNNGIELPMPIDVPNLSFVDKTKVYDTNPVKENLTPFSNVPDSTEPKIVPNKKPKSKKDSNAQYNDLHTVSLSTLEMAKRSVEERMKKNQGINTKTNRKNILESATENNVNSIPPLSAAVKRFSEPTKDELDKVKAVTNNLFGGTKSDFTPVVKHSEDRSSYENIMASGHLVNATKKHEGNLAKTTKANDNGSSISPFMNEILNKINEPAPKNANFESATIKNVNFSGNVKEQLRKEEGRLHSGASKPAEVGNKTKSFIDQLNASMALHPNKLEDEKTNQNQQISKEVQTKKVDSSVVSPEVNQYKATSAPTDAEKDAMRTQTAEPVVSSQLSGNGNENYIEKNLSNNQVAVGNYNSTAKPLGGGTLVDEDEDIVEDVQDEPDDLESAIAGLSGSRVVESARVKYKFPPLELVKDYPETSNVIDEFTKQKAQRLIETLAEFKYTVTLRNIIKGPTVTMFEIVPDPGIRVNSITNLSDNIAMNLAAEKVRILAPIPGETAVGVEIPNSKRDIVGFKEILTKTDTRKMAIPMTMGRNLYGSCKIFDVATSPHMLVAGSTGSGKSVCINSLICSILYTRTPKDVRLIMVDPKVVELTIYNGIPHLLTPVITETKRALKALDFCIDEMERRNKMLARMSVRNIKSYNEKIKTNRVAVEKMPYIVVIIDEFASLMSTAGKDLDDRVARLTAMSRAVGIHLVFATQRPSVDVITGVIKNNLPTRIAFAVTSSQDSRTIISSTGAENLLGKGDLLLSENGKSVSRLQGVFLSDDEVEQIVDFAKAQGPTDYIDESYFESYDDDDEGDDSYDTTSSVCAEDGDELWESALKIVVERKSASASFLQRRLRIGYNRAARLVEEMEEKGIVGPPNGSKPRELLRYPDMVSNE
jgi:S-DNA-T family DNA segregation ATPase FtsK/SpoIIIE